VNVNVGPIDLQGNAGNAPLRLRELSFTPTMNLVGGELCVRDGDLFVYNVDRVKWLSVSTVSAPFSSNSNGYSGYLYYGSAQVNGTTGFSFPWDGTIVGISARCQNESVNNWIEIYLNGCDVGHVDWGTNNTSSSTWSEHIDNNILNIDFEHHDEIQIYCPNSGTKPSKPCVTLYVRKKI